ncbi:MAG: DUF4412 domain-containing protein [Bacteroidales bacterium]|nr:DUF4412 domain-containing protein [Bacteroidales bacterium]
MVNFLLSFLLVLFSINSDAESFEGSIKMVQKTCYETSYFTYFVNHENVRIDKFDVNHIPTQSIIINLKDKQVHVLNPHKKLFTKVDINSTPSDNNNDFSILKTENSKLIDNHLCYQWRVKNKESNTEVAYWVIQNNFYFFEELIELLNSVDNSFTYFEKIPETQGFFPLLTVERTLLRKEKNRLSILQINNEKIEENLFKIPNNFKLVRN